MFAFMPIYCDESSSLSGNKILKISQPTVFLLISFSKGTSNGNIELVWFINHLKGPVYTQDMEIRFYGKWYLLNSDKGYYLQNE